MKIHAIGFPLGEPDDLEMGTFFGPHNCTALFVRGIGRVGKKECERIEMAFEVAPAMLDMLKRINDDVLVIPAGMRNKIRALIQRAEGGVK